MPKAAAPVTADAVRLASRRMGVKNLASTLAVVFTLRPDNLLERTPEP